MASFKYVFKVIYLQISTTNTETSVTSNPRWVDASTSMVKSVPLSNLYLSSNVNSEEILFFFTFPAYVKFLKQVIFMK